MVRLGVAVLPDVEVASRRAMTLCGDFLMPAASGQYDLPRNFPIFREDFQSKLHLQQFPRYEAIWKNSGKVVSVEHEITGWRNILFQRNLCYHAAEERNRLPNLKLWGTFLWKRDPKKHFFNFGGQGSGLIPVSYIE